MSYPIEHTYYRVVDTNYSTHVYSTLDRNYVVFADAGYVAFLAAGQIAETYQTQDSLFRFFAAYGYPQLIEVGIRVPTTNINGLLRADLMRAYSSGTLELPSGVTTDTGTYNPFSGFVNEANGVVSSRDNYTLEYPAFANVFSQFSGFSFPNWSDVTISATNPCVVTWLKGNHGFQVNDSVTFRTTDTLPSPVSTATTYYITAIPAADTFKFSATLGGAEVDTSSPGSPAGTHYATLVGGSLVRNEDAARKEVVRFNNGVQVFDDAGAPPTGGDKGFGTVNVPTNYYINGLKLYSADVWTPTVTTDATVGTPAYNVRVGTYELIGKMCTARFVVNLSGWTGSPTGNVRISGLPFTSDGTSNNYGTCLISYYAVTGLDVLNYGMSGHIPPSTTYINLTQNGNTASALVTAAQAGTTATFWGSANYRIV